MLNTTVLRQFGTERTFHIIDSGEAHRIIEDIFDAGEGAQDLRLRSRHRAVEGVVGGDTLLRQAVLHFLRSEERETSIDRILKNVNQRHRN